MRSRERRWAWTGLALIVVVIGVVPVVLDRDSYPLSTYPMFSYRRTATEAVDTAVARTADGGIRRLGPETIAATDEVILAAATVTNAIGAGQADTLCREIAARAPAGAVAIEVVTERYDAIDWFQGRRDPLERTVHARCPVGG